LRYGCGRSGCGIARTDDRVAGGFSLGIQRPEELVGFFWADLALAQQIFNAFTEGVAHGGLASGQEYAPEVYILSSLILYKLMFSPE
jgi:hypothetical protein